MICYCSSSSWGYHQDPHVEPIAPYIECPNKGALKGQMGNQLGYVFLRILVWGLLLHSAYWFT